MLSPELGETGKFSNYVWSFTDKVARMVAERCPGKMIGTFAYEHYREVPTKPETMAPNVAVMICYTRVLSVDPEKKALARNTIANWAKKVKNLYFWTYPIFDYWPPWRGFPRFYPDILTEDIRMNAELGAHGEFLESESMLPGDQDVSYVHIAFPGLTHLTAYVTVKLLWDAQTDVRALLDEYYTKFYGAAEGPMRRFWEKAEDITMHRNGDHPVKVFTEKDIREFLALLDEASALVPADSAEGKRVDKIRQEMLPFIKKMLNQVEGKRDLVLPLVPETLDVEDPLLDTAWEKGARYKLLAKDGFESDFDTMLLAAADTEGLGIALVCMEPEMANLTLRADKRDGEVWDDDSIEIFIDHDNDTHGRHFIVSAADVVWDGEWEGANGLEDSRWNSDFRHRVIRGEDRWIVQVKIPWEELDATPATSGDLRINVYRNRVIGKGVRYASFSPNMSSQHRMMEFFGHLKLGE